MQSVIDAFSVEETASSRQVAQSTLLSWNKSLLSSIRIFTIGVSTIGGSDVIGGTDVYASAWNKYQYTDESSYVTALSYERALNQPIGGMVKALADIKMDNTSGRFTPRYAGGSSAIFTAVGKPRRPVIINAGFNFNGIDNLIPQFVGVTSKSPKIDMRNRSVEFMAEDFIGFLQNQYVDQSAMFTGLRSDEVIENLLVQAGFSTSQYDLDYGINRIKFGEFQPGDKFGDIINKIAQAEFANFYQDEQGKLRYENRQHWTQYPHFNVQRVITTAQVINAETPDTEHIINVVEVKSKPRGKQPQQLVWKLSGTIEIPGSSDKEVFVNFDDPMLEVLTPQFYTANSDPGGSGTDLTSNVTVKSFTKFARAAKIIFTNSSTSTAHITSMELYGRPAKVEQEIYYREQDSSSRTAYEERVYAIENEYIQDTSWAQSFARMVLQDFSEPENIQKLTIRAVPELQLGDLISWQGRYWRIFGIKTKMDASGGFTQEIDILQRTPVTYFRIGISTIGGSDQIAP